MWHHTAQTPAWISGACSRFRAENAWRNTQEETRSLLTHMWAGALTGPPGARRHKQTRNELPARLQPDTEGKSRKSHGGEDESSAQAHLKRISSCAAVRVNTCGYIETAQHARFQTAPAVLREGLCRPCGDVLPAVETSFENTRRHKNNHRLECIHTHTVALWRCRGAAGTNKPCSFSTGFNSAQRQNFHASVI